MKTVKKILSVCLALCMLLSLVSISATATETAQVKVELDGNQRAVITASQDITAVNLDSTLASVELDGKTAYVTAVADSQEIINATVVTTSGSSDVEIPLGYTTFYFSGKTLTVYEGEDTKYEVAGINMADEEYLEGDATYPLSVDYDEDGNAVYKNTDTYSINVAIKKKGGSYVFYGNSDDMSVCVKKEATAASTLILAGLNLSSSFTAPITVKKDSTTTAEIYNPKGFINTLVDSEMNNEDLHGEAGTVDTVNPEYAESAVIKGKACSNLTISGEGTLNLVCNSKNAVKVGDYGSLTIKDITLNITSVNHGISSDNTLTVNSGNIDIVCEGDAIRSDPDTVDATLGLSAEIEIAGGDISIMAGSDGIQANEKLIITGGNFNIKTGNGYNDTSFDSDTQSCKGLKASVNTDDTDDTSELTCQLDITGGTFYLNCADDAVHSDAYINITGGTFVIFTGDDGVHADTLLEVGVQDSNSGVPVINVMTCYEGLESGTVNIYDGTIRVTATDDGINAAGGSDSTDANQGFNPGGMRPGQNNNTQTSSSDYSINFYGGDIFVNAMSDGIDSNGDINFLGGTIIVWGASSGDGEPIDKDGSMVIDGSTLLVLGQRSSISTGSTQKVISTNTSVSEGKTVSVTYNSGVVLSTKAVKSCSYVAYSSPDMTSTSGWSISVSSASSTDSCTHTNCVTAKENYVHPSCTADGGYTQVVYCADCSEEINSTVVTIPATGHTEIIDEAVEATSTQTGLTQGCHCLVCGVVIVAQETVEIVSGLIGDVDLDGNITVMDATAIQKYLAMIEDLSDEQLAVANTDGDDSISVMDATQIQLYLAKLIDKLG